MNESKEIFRGEWGTPFLLSKQNEHGVFILSIFTYWEDGIVPERGTGKDRFSIIPNYKEGLFEIYVNRNKPLEYLWEYRGKTKFDCFAFNFLQSDELTIYSYVKSIDEGVTRTGLLPKASTFTLYMNDKPVFLNQEIISNNNKKQISKARVL